MKPLPPDCPQCGSPMVLNRFACAGCDAKLEGGFELPALARLSPEEQIFVIAFVRVHGSLKRMEELFDISYPTVKSRLANLARKLDKDFVVPDERSVVLDRLARGEITVSQALELLP
ncbi:MAG: DUF2089 domain-containing protein [Planctomycetota bacterium]|nr:DUF2089 domain-containing protein [Planctomycetota bacterium]